MAQFKGSIDMKISHTMDGKPEEVLFTMFVDQDKIAAKVKSDQPGMGGGRFIFRGDKMVLWIVDDAERNYFEISFNNQDTADETNLEEEMKVPKPTFKKIGKTQTILGYKCDEWRVEHDGKVSNIWATPKLGDLYDGLVKSFGQMGQKKRDDDEDWQSELAIMKVFPLKIVTSENGKVTETQEVTKIEAKAVPASTFEAPQGYAKQSFDLNMQKLMKEMQEQMDKMKKEQEEEEDKEDEAEDDDGV
ncbi:MAG: DUF4412 domain-containing protein [Ignavibacteriae bacterium]|nr:DUF4412 domain-containing protein [Ignavibacteriota bacterium]